METPLNQIKPIISSNANSDLDSDNDSNSIISASTGRSENSKNENSNAGIQRSSKTRGRKSKNNKNPIKAPKSPYKLNAFVTESGNKQIFAIQFNNFIKNRNIFATASGFRVSIYECIKVDEDDEDSCGIKFIRAYDDPDRGEFENFEEELRNSS